MTTSTRRGTDELSLVQEPRKLMRLWAGTGCVLMWYFCISNTCFQLRILLSTSGSSTPFTKFRFSNFFHLFQKWGNSTFNTLCVKDKKPILVQFCDILLYLIIWCMKSQKNPKLMNLEKISYYMPVPEIWPNWCF